MKRENIELNELTDFKKVPVKYLETYGVSQAFEDALSSLCN
jgi:hypothetical protein